MSGDSAARELPVRGANTIYSAAVDFQVLFNAITRRAADRFEARDWRGMQDDSRERLDLYRRVMGDLVSRLRDLLGRWFHDPEMWKLINLAYRELIADRQNPELSETFFNSVTRRLFSTVGVNPEIEFIRISEPDMHHESDPSIHVRHIERDDTTDLILRILRGFRFRGGFRDIDRDAGFVAQRVEEYLERNLGSARIDSVEMLRPLFYRGKGAYIVGRLRCGASLLPLVLPLRNDDEGIAVDAVLMNEDEVSILFSFARSYFQVEVDRPRDVIAFLKSVMPLKPVAELFTSLGFNKHGKTELYRGLQRHLGASEERFEFAEGDRGMVMIVFGLSNYDVVFKVIRDSFAYPKRTTRAAVMERYRLVFQRDRVGRLIDAQEFEHLNFSRERFSEPLLEELVESAGSTVSVVGKQVVIHHLYTERRMTPLNVFLRQASEEAARMAVIDYGEAVKDLAKANIFPGDFLLKNFGVTRHGRVVFYDYDELCPLTDCTFRRIPPPRSEEEALSPEPWYTTDENDIFPEEFAHFLGIQSPLREVFVRYHGDLFTVDFWRDLQERHLRGEILDFYPYPESRRLL